MLKLVPLILICNHTLTPVATFNRESDIQYYILFVWAYRDRWRFRERKYISLKWKKSYLTPVHCTHHFLISLAISHFIYTYRITFTDIRLTFISRTYFQLCDTFDRPVQCIMDNVEIHHTRCRNNYCQMRTCFWFVSINAVI